MSCSRSPPILASSRPVPGEALCHWYRNPSKPVPTNESASRQSSYKYRYNHAHSSLSLSRVAVIFHFSVVEFHARGTGIPVCGWSDLHVDEIMLFCCPVDGRCTTITACRSRLVFQSLTQNVLDRSDEGISPSPCSYTVYSKVHVLVLDPSRPNNRRVTI